MLRLRYLLLSFVITLCWCMVAQAQPQSGYIIHIDGAIGPAVQDYVSRAIHKANDEQASLVVLQMDTPGGLSKSMRGIIKTMLNSRVPIVVYVAPSGARAASAGTYILYAAQIAAMAPGTNLGAATPVSIGGGDKTNQDQKSKKPSASEQKAMNDARAYIRSLAKMRGRNVAWAELAVTKAASLTAKEALQKNVIDVVADTLPQLLAKIDGRQVKVADSAVTLQTKHLILKTIHPDWRAKFLAVITDPTIAYLLLMAGFYGLFFEFISPGAMVPGVLGGICLVLGLYALQLLPVSYAGLGLVLLGMAFMVCEAFVPSFGILGIGGIAALIVGSILLLEEDVVGFALSTTFVSIMVAVTIVFFVGMLWYVMKSRRKPLLSGYATILHQQGEIVVGRNATWVRVNGELWQVDNPAAFKPGERVIVDKVVGPNVIVSKNE